MARRNPSGKACVARGVAIASGTETITPELIAATTIDNAGESAARTA